MSYKQKNKPLEVEVISELRTQIRTFAKNPKLTPDAPPLPLCSLEQSRAEKLPFPFRKKDGARKIKKCNGNFSARQYLLAALWQGETIGFLQEFLIK